MTEADQGAPPEQIPLPTKEELLFKRVNSVGDRHAAEVRRFFDPMPSGLNPEITVEHLFLPPLRRAMVISAVIACEDAAAHLRSNTVGMDIGDLTVNRGLQTLVAVLHNRAAEAASARKVSMDPQNELFVPLPILETGIQSILRQLQTVPETRRSTITLLDLADNILLNLMKGRKSRPLKRGRKPNPIRSQ